jgi:hypothetical protein
VVLARERKKMNKHNLMIYFKKDDYFFYRLDAETFTCTELFSSGLQKRVMVTKDEQIYNDTLNRIQGAGFVSATAEEFNELLTHVLTKLGE